MYKEDSALNNPQRLICHKTKPNIIYLVYMNKEDLSFDEIIIIIIVIRQ